MKELESKRDRCLLIATLARCRASLEARPCSTLARDQEQLFGVIEAVAAEEVTNARGAVSPVDRNGRLAEVLKMHFDGDDAVWSYVRWSWSGNGLVGGK